jgi:hypothetical protein
MNDTSPHQPLYPCASMRVSQAFQRLKNEVSLQPLGPHRPQTDSRDTFSQLELNLHKSYTMSEARQSNAPPEGQSQISFEIMSYRTEVEQKFKAFLARKKALN